MKQQMKASAYHLKQADVKKLVIAAITFRDRCVIKTLWWLGLRRQELVDFDVRDIDFERKRVKVRFCAAYLSGVQNLTQGQLNEATADETTELPEGLTLRSMS